MNILFDQTEAQATYFNGAAEYAQTLFLKMVSLLEDYPDVTLFSLYSSTRRFKYEALSPTCLSGYDRVISIDYSKKNLKQIVKEYNIDLLFITCAQSFCDLPIGNISNIGCKVVMVIHDMYVEEMSIAKIEYLHYLNHPWRFVYNSLGRLKVRLFSKTMTSRATLMRRLIEENDSSIITVSNYTKQSIGYHFPNYAEKTDVFYSPMKVNPQETKDINNIELKELIESGEKYYLLLSADRITKNGERMLRAFKCYVENNKVSAFVVTTGYKKKLFPQHVALPFLTSSDIDHAYRHCYALLYPSLFEGFGYPPVEAMRYGKAVLSSNVCSMPEILGNAPIYFSPIYESSMYGALQSFSLTPYELMKKKAEEQFCIIKEKQNNDLRTLSHKLLNGYFTKKTTK
jgi:glycosyltransferase involved in cell wall biosynthesis